MKNRIVTTCKIVGIMTLSLLAFAGCGQENTAVSSEVQVDIEENEASLGAQSETEENREASEISSKTEENREAPEVSSEAEENREASSEIEENQTPPEVSSGLEGKAQASNAEKSKTQETITVDSIEELIWEIAPNKNIVLASGYYNMSDYLEDVWKEQGENWNENNPYVKIRECFDGAELVIYRADGLQISGEAAGDTEIVVDPRYANVLTFEECSDIALDNLVMGHTDTGNCVGNVLQLNDCRDITLQSLDLYGCGVYGIGIDQGTRDLQVYDSIIRECEYGPLEIWDAGGDIAFYRCKLIDSGGHGVIMESLYYTVSFYECEFGDNETSGIVFMDHVYTENCTWGSGFAYPDIMEPEVLYFPETKERAGVSKTFLKDTFWSGYAMVDQKTGRTDLIGEYNPIDAAMWINVELNEDGSGLFEYGNDIEQITWGFDDKEAEVFIQLPDGTKCYMLPYFMSDKYDRELWLSMEWDGYMIWLRTW